MSSLKICKIIFGEPNEWHFVTLHSGEHGTQIVENRHEIDIEVVVPSSVKLEEVEKIAMDKAKKLIKELAGKL